jgi:uncharacterized protein (DUF488 family)
VPLQRILTVGAYGFTAERFFAALVAAECDLFCDLRARRGVRGREYAFVNSQRLQEALAVREIEYRHYRELAPTPEIRTMQKAEDTASGTAKRERHELAPRFAQAYEHVLDTPEARGACEAIALVATRPALFCVERLPQACHRSLVAARLGGGTIPVQDIIP